MNRFNFLKLLTICLVAVFVFSCTQKCDVYINRPSDLRAIDWNGYNAVLDVFWHYFSDNCRGAGWPTEDIIKVYGKIDPNSIHFEFDLYTQTHRLHSFELMDMYEREHNFIYDFLYNNYSYRAFSIRIFSNFSDELQEKLANSDLTKISYITGRVSTGMLGGGRSEGNFDGCCFVFPLIRIYSIDDIYFETN